MLAWVISAAHPTHAANNIFTNTAGGSWEDANNWTGGSPDSTDFILITNNGTYTVLLNNTTADTDPGGASSWLTISNLNLGNLTGLPTLLLDFTNTAKALTVGVPGSGILNVAHTTGTRGDLVLSNGTLIVKNNFNIGEGAASLGTLRVDGGTAIADLAGNAIRAGNTATATGMIFVTAGRLVATNGASATSFIGNAGRGVLDQTGGTVLFNLARFGNSSAGNGEWNLHGGTGMVLSTSASALQLGAVAGTTGKVLVAGGTLSMTGTAQVGNSGYGSIIFSNGSLTAGVVTLGSAAGGSGDFNIHSGNAQIVVLNLGDGGATSRGAARITGGTLTVAGNSSGALNIGDSAGAQASLEILGGVVTATGGGNDLRIGNTAGATGTVLVANAELVVTNGASTASFIGNAGRGVLTVSNGFVRTMLVRMGNSSAGDGEWNIHGGTNEVLSTSSIAMLMGVAAGTTGKVNVSGGKFSVAGTMEVGRSGFGSLSVSNGSFSSGAISIGGLTGGSGEVQIHDGPGTHSLGTVTVAASSSTRGLLNHHSGDSTAVRLNAGEAGGALGTINLLDGSVLVTDTGAPIRIGNAIGATGVFNVANGTLVATNTTGAISFIGNAARGTMNISNGTVILQAVRLGNSSVGHGDYNVYGGTNEIRATIGVGQAANLTGTVVMAGGRMQVGTDGSTTIATTLGVSGRGILIVSNGTFISRGVNIGQNAGSSGEMRILGGTATLGSPVGNNLIVGPSSSTGSVLVSGPGVVEFNRSVQMGGATGIGHFTNQNGGTVRFVLSANDPTFTVNAGSSFVMTNAIFEFKDYTAARVFGGITNITRLGNNTLSLNNSTNQILGSYTFQTNNAPDFAFLRLVNGGARWQSTNLNIGTGGQMLVSNSTATVRGILTNQGTISVVNSRVTYENPVTISGSYVSDPSTNTFLSNVTVSVTGTIAGGMGDLFDFKKNFSIHNNSNNSGAFDLSSSTVRFSGGAPGSPAFHTNLITGVDLGNDGTNGFADGFTAQNFSYGTLALGATNDFVFFDTGDGASSNALYVLHLDLFGSTNFVANLDAPANITVYYGHSLLASDNAYLMDKTYTLASGGLLMPAVPEPSTLMLLLAACGALLLRKRRNGQWKMVHEPISHP